MWKERRESEDTWLERWGGRSAAYGKEANSKLGNLMQATMPTKIQGWEDGRKTDNLY